MSANLPSAGLLQRLLRVYAVQFAHAADEQNASAAERHGRPKPAPVDVAKFEAKPWPMRFLEDGSVCFDPTTNWGHTLATGAESKGVDRVALLHAAVRCIATAAELIKKAGES